MRFKNFIEDQGSDKGLMGYGTPYVWRKPSDGQPFSKYLSAVAGQGQSAGAGTTAAKPMFMKKKMKKK